MFTAPAETCNANLEVLGFERRGVRAQGFEEARDTGMADSGARPDSPWYDFHRETDSQDGFDKNVS